MLKFFRSPGRYGQNIAFVRGTLTGTIANSSTTTFSTGGVHRKSVLERLSISTRTVPASASGTILAVVYKYDASAASAVALTGNVDLEALTADVTSKITLLSTLTDSQRIFDEGDTIRVVITTTNTVGTQAADLILTAEVSVIA